MSAPGGKSRVRLGIEIALAIVVLVGIFVWSEGLLRDKVAPDGEEAARGGVYSGAVATVARREIPVFLEAVGTVRPVRVAGVSSRVMGVVSEIRVEEGNRVSEGQVLAVVSAPELASRREAARETVAAAQASLAQAERDHARVQKLYERQAATEVEWEQARTALEVARANLQRARRAAEGEAAVASYTRLHAPFDGLVLDRMKDPGDLASPGVPLVRVADDSRYRLEASVEEGRASRMAVGDPVEIHLDALGWRGDSRVEEIVPAADPVSRTVLVKAALPDLDGLRTGQFGRMRVPLDARRALVIPVEAVRTVGGVDLVRVVDEEGRVVSRYVRLGLEAEPGRMEVLSGLEEGERVALEGSTLSHE